MAKKKPKHPQRPEKLNPWTRRNKLQIRFNDGELADLKIIAMAWECEVPQVVWAILATYLSDRRGRKAMHLPYPYTALNLLKHVNAYEVNLEEQSGVDPGGTEPDEGPGERLRGNLLGDAWENREGELTGPDEEPDEPGV
jgi:hypothetical protein